MPGRGRRRGSTTHRSHGPRSLTGQVVGQQLFADAQLLPGFVTGAYARPEAGEPFQLSFSGPVPDELDPDAYELDSFGLQVTSGAARFDPDAFATAFDAASQVGMHPVSGSGDESAGTGRIEVIADARQRADRQGEALPNEQGEDEPTAERAEEVRRSYLGLTLEQTEDKAAQEDRTVRVTTQDGVQLGSNDDLQPGRLSLTICNGVVVDTHMDLEPQG